MHCECKPKARHFGGKPSVQNEASLRESKDAVYARIFPSDSQGSKRSSAVNFE